LHLKIDQHAGGGTIAETPANGTRIVDSELTLEGYAPLFPGLQKRASKSNFCIHLSGGNVLATLCAGSALPVERVFRNADILSDASGA
jgi:hypothetical protein